MIKCPLCEAENPEDAKVCQVCGTQLKSSQPGDFPSTPPFRSDDLLAGLREAGTVEPDANFFTEEDLPDSEQEISETGEVPEWLQRIRQISEEGQETTSENDWLNAAEEETPDWIRALAPQDEQAAAEEPVEQPEAGFELPGSTSQAEEDESPPDWLKELESWKPASDTPPLDFGSGVEPAAGEAGEEPEELGEDQLPDWLRMAAPGISPAGSTQEEELTLPEETGGDAFVPSEMQEADGGLDEWLSRLGASSEEDGEPAPLGDLSTWNEISAQIPEVTGETPDVIELPAGLETENETGMALEEEQTQPQTGGLSDWMRLREEPALEKADGAKEQSPEWMLQKEKAPEPEAQDELFERAPERMADDKAHPDDKSHPKDILPDWLTGGKAAKGADAQEPQQEWDFDAGIDEKTQIEPDDLSDWLGDLALADSSTIFETKDDKEKLEEEKPANIPPFVGENLAEWMLDDHSADQADQSEGGETAIEEPEILQKADLPDWLGEPSAVAMVRDEMATEETPAGEIKEGELPDWLSAMRPIEAVLPQQSEVIDDKKVEQAGPLAGLRAVLSGQPAATHYRKPPIYSLKLQVSEKQRAHAAMLENLLEDEKRYPAVKPSRQHASQRVLRVLVGLLLIAVVLLPLMGFPQADIKVGQIANVGAFYRVIEEIPAGSPVLLAVDYAPGYSGEMRFAAKGVIQSLMLRELRLAAVSTQATGPVLAEGLKNLALEQFPEYEERYNQRDWFINLGYLPGETISLQEFARRPQQAAQYGISAGLENRPVWDSAVLQNVNQLDDFALVILITDTLESGRAWIEQVQPSLVDVPFLVISSAQAAPMLQPYTQSGQVQGLLAGMAGGLSFEELTLIPGLDRGAFWLSNQFGLATAILIILLGALFEGISSLAGRNRPDQEA